jgi:prevent-host-death family protein
MNHPWQLQNAKNRFSEVVESAMRSGPQEITRHGAKAAVVISYRDYTRLKARGGRSLSRFFRESPLRGLEITRTRDLPRQVDL